MYTIAVKRDLIASHSLVGGDWGNENERHAHHYVVEVRLEGRQLDQHGYLADICDLESVLDRLVNFYRDKTLNELPEFKDLNPSIENFARILCQNLAAHFPTDQLDALSVKIWENDMAWAEFRKKL
jgi:6-pyruvoyltetrahydropterin/6-carboxytetrahydropterin synthase